MKVQHLLESHSLKRVTIKVVRRMSHRREINHQPMLNIRQNTIPKIQEAIIRTKIYFLKGHCI